MYTILPEKESVWASLFRLAGQSVADHRISRTEAAAAPMLMIAQIIRVPHFLPGFCPPGGAVVGGYLRDSLIARTSFFV